jgi:hypothetical protein
MMMEVKGLEERGDPSLPRVASLAQAFEEDFDAIYRYAYRRAGRTCSARRGPRATYDDAVAVLEDAAQIPAYRLAQDVAIEKILAALAATRDGLGNPPATP